MKQITRSIFTVFLSLFVLASCSGRHDVQSRQGKPLYASVEDVAAGRIGVLLGSTHDQYARKNFTRATILEYKSLPDLIMAVKTGKADAGIYNSVQLPELLHEQSELGILGKPLFSSSTAMGFKKGDKELRMSFNKFLAEIRQNGVYDDMVRRWMKNRDTHMPDIRSNEKAKRTLVVGNVFDMGLPFTAVSDNRLVGFNVELIDRFGVYLGKNVVYRNLEFGNLIASLSTGKIDMIGSVLAITPERAKSIDFSDPYFDADACMFALRKNIAVPGVDSGKTDNSDVPTSFFSGIVESFRNNIIRENRWKLIVEGLQVTIVISFLSALLGTFLGGFICLLRMSKNMVLQSAGRTYITIMRGIPVLVVLMLIFYVVFASVNIDPVFVSVIAFGMNFAAYAAEIYRAGIESIDRGQTEAGVAMGFTKVQIFLDIILPQTVMRILPVYKGEFITLVKMTSIVGYIAVQDLTKASDIIRSRTFDAFFPIIMVAVLYFLISWTLMLLIDRLEVRSFQS
ncbi:MAG: ABC transporter permease subunit [Chlorobium sp.]|nr:MAG: ABC transporter permease subunit [Chlorobium sp.]